MPLAAKNNALIVKDGKVAENCNCCGGWYCCEDRIGQCRDKLGDVLRVTISTTAVDYSIHELKTGCYNFTCNRPEWLERTMIIPGSLISGTHVMTDVIKESRPPTWSRIYTFRKRFPASVTGAGNCTPSNFAELGAILQVIMPGDGDFSGGFPTQTILRASAYFICPEFQHYAAFDANTVPVSPGTRKTLSDMSCAAITSGDCSTPSLVSNRLRFSQRNNSLIGSDPQSYGGLCSISTPISIPMGSLARFLELGRLNCFAGDSPGTILSEAGSRFFTGSVLIEAI